MPVFHVRYRNAQGALMRILNAISRRGLDLISVHAEAAGELHAVTVVIDVTSKQVGQLRREWYAIVDVIDVHSSNVHSSSASLPKHQDGEWVRLPPASASVAEQSARAAQA